MKALRRLVWSRLVIGPLKRFAAALGQNLNSPSEAGHELGQLLDLSSQIDRLVGKVGGEVPPGPHGPAQLVGEAALARDLETDPGSLFLDPMLEFVGVSHGGTVGGRVLTRSGLVTFLGSDGLGLADPGAHADHVLATLGTPVRADRMPR